MIEITNLMVGDWVINQADQKIKVTPELFLSDHLNDSYEPIPLTPEILEKNGWVLKEWSGHKQFQYTIVECGDEITYKIDYERPHFIVPCFRSSLELKYVHNFQHLLKECKIEKEITL